MNKVNRVIAVVLAALLVISAVSFAFADGFTQENVELTDAQKVLRGFVRGKGYVYMNFGSYPFERDGTVKPCTWRVLAIENDCAFLLNDYIIGYYQCHYEKVDPPTWKDYMLYGTLNNEIIYDMFNEDEREVLRDSEQLGKLFILDDAEFSNGAYGFQQGLTTVQPARECKATPYAKGDKHSYTNKNGNTWYWSRTCRNTAAGGYQRIIGYNGHISMAGYLRWGGVRPACYVKLSMLDHVSGTGKHNDPFVFEIVK